MNVVMVMPARRQADTDVYHGVPVADHDPLAGLEVAEIQIEIELKSLPRHRPG